MLIVRVITKLSVKNAFARIASPEFIALATRLETVDTKPNGRK